MRLARCSPLAIYLASSLLPLSQSATFTPLAVWRPPGLFESHRMANDGARSYFAAGSTGLLILDTADPNNPKLLGTYTDPAGEAAAVAVKDGIAFVAYGARELQIVDVSDPAQPFRIAGFYGEPGPGGGGGYGSGASTVAASDVVIQGNTVCLADGRAGLQIIDVSDAGHPTALGHYYATEPAFQVELQNQYVKLNGHFVLSVSPPDSPTLIANEPAPPVSTRVTSVVAANGLAYVTVDYSGLHILDVSVPSKPSRIGALPLDSYVAKVVVSDKRAFIANYSYGLQIVDVSDPVHPLKIGNYVTERNAWGVAVSGNHAFVAAGSLDILDISTPSTPKRLGVYRYPVFLAYDVSAWGNYVFAMKWNGGNTDMIDVSNPETPVLVASIPSTAFDMAISDQTAFVVADDDFSMFNIADPRSPVLTGRYSPLGTPAQYKGIALGDRTAFVANGPKGIMAFDVSDVARPHLLGTLATSGNSMKVAASGNLLFVADSEAGLTIFREFASEMPVLRAVQLDRGLKIEVIGVVGRKYVLESTSDWGANTKWTTSQSFVLESNPQAITQSVVLAENRYFRVREE